MTVLMTTGRNWKDGMSEVERLERRRKALEMRTRGNSLQRIGDALGITKQRAHDLVSEELAEIPRAAREQLQALEAEKLDRGQKRIEKLLRTIVDPRETVASVDALTRISARRSAMLGLDEPTRQALSVDGVPPETLDAAFEVIGAAALRENPLELAKKLRTLADFLEANAPKT